MNAVRFREALDADTDTTTHQTQADGHLDIFAVEVLTAHPLTHIATALRFGADRLEGRAVGVIETFNALPIV